MAVLAEPIDRAALRVALEQRCADWRQRLRSDFPDEARYVVQQLIGPLELWVDAAEDLFGCPEELTALEAAGIDLSDETGKPAFADCGFKAVVKPRGLLNGLVAESVVAGAGFEPATFGL